MNYTNGIDFDAVVPAMQQRLGWRQPTKAGSPVVSAGNLVSKSKRYFNSTAFHAIVTLDNIKNAQEDAAITDDNLNAFLVDMQSDCIVRSLTEVFREPELIEQVLMYTRFATMDMPIANSGQAIGWLINTANDPAISTQIKYATFYFDSDVSFNLYLFMDGVKAPIKTIPIDVVAYQRTLVNFDASGDTDTTLVLNFESCQKYYLCYFQNDLGEAKAIREQVETFATTRCFEAFVFNAPQLTDSETPDFDHNYRSYGFLPQGVNLGVISFKDHTQRVLRQANLFDEVQGLQMATMAAELILYSTRTNIVERQTAQAVLQLHLDINQAKATDQIPTGPGLKSRIQKEFARLRETFYPAQQPISSDMTQNRLDLSADSQWAKQNYRTLTNPSPTIIPY